MPGQWERLSWDGKSMDGQLVPNGIDVCRLVIEGRLEKLEKGFQVVVFR